MLRKPCRLQTDGQTDKVNPVYPPSNFVGRGYKNVFETAVCKLSAMLLRYFWYWHQNILSKLGQYIAADNLAPCIAMLSAAIV